MIRPSTFLLLAALVLAACSAPTQPTGAAPDVAGGQELFALNCGECHGEDGLGTDEAPAVLGHSVEELTNQVRTPEGDMEAIPPDKLSDEDLALIAAYVASLPAEAAHSDVAASPDAVPHLEAALEAIRDHENMDRETALAHLEQAAALTDGEEAELYQEFIESIVQGRAGNARHEMKELLGLMESD